MWTHVFLHLDVLVYAMWLRDYTFSARCHFAPKRPFIFVKKHSWLSSMTSNAILSDFQPDSYVYRDLGCRILCHLKLKEMEHA